MGRRPIRAEQKVKPVSVSLTPDAVQELDQLKTALKKTASDIVISGIHLMFEQNKEKIEGTNAK